MQKYNLEWLLKSLEKQENHSYLFFWAHQPNVNGIITEKCFSQWWTENPFVVDGIVYQTAEHWMMAKKALLFEDTEFFEKIIEAETSAIVQKLGRQVRNFELDVWQKHCSEIVAEGNFHKFSQHQPLKDFLLSTENKIIVEASPYDKIWGIGMGVNRPEIYQPSLWKGTNLLGFALMEVRDKLR
ncbi:MAG: NADAR family protein [Bacteroidetes bacterium]|nr:MAG: NADAR family protein [Bacteroidota bacterium]TAG87171.1 MAG: NADAR family protein [Bacteroidota bacterium]